MGMVKGCGVLVLILVIVVCLSSFGVSETSEKEIRERFYGNLVNSRAADNGEGSIAKMFDCVSEKEFSETDQPEGSGESSFNCSVADQQAELETVAKITHEKIKKNETKEANDKLGLSLELGSFVAGVMISTTKFAQHTLDQVEPIRNLFAALFLFSTGMLIHVQFLWTHVDILLASGLLVVAVKTTVAAVITKAFGYSLRTSFIVGVLLAQIGEFALFSLLVHQTYILLRKKVSMIRSA